MAPAGPSLPNPPSLLPLLKPDPLKVLNADSPPLHLYPRDYLPGIESRRIVATTRSSRGIETNWISTTHLFPGAYPRSHPNATSPSSESGRNGKFSSEIKVVDNKEEAKLQRQRDLKEFKEIWEHESNSFQSIYPDASGKTEEEADQEARDRVKKLRDLNCPQLWSCVERIVPIQSQNLEGNEVDRNDGQGITLVFAHANGFHKEIWEPTIESVLSTLAKGSESSDEPIPRIDEIWSIDSVQSGEAGALNREVLGDVVSWIDHPRDISQLLNHFIPPKASFREVIEETVETQAASYPFPPKKKKVIKKKRVLSPDGRSTGGICWPGIQLKRTREGEGRKGRRFVGVGHSFGGAAMAILSNAEPELFEAVILLDPVMAPPGGFSYLRETKGLHEVPIAIGAIVRKDSWSSKAEAVEYFNSKPFFRAWDPRVLSKHLQFGLRTIDPSSSESQQSGGIPYTLCCNKWHEGSAFALTEGSPGFRALASQRFKGNYYIVTMKDGSIYAKDVEVMRKVREAPGKGSGWGELLEGDHLVAQEQPLLIGEKIANILPKLLIGENSSPASQAVIPRPKL